MQNSREMPTPSKKQESNFAAKPVLKDDVALLLEKIRIECIYKFWYFATMALMERPMCFFCGSSVSKWIIFLGLCGFAINFPTLGQVPKSDYVR